MNDYRRPPRVLLVWCPDWPVHAAALVDGVSPHEPVAVLRAGRVHACSPAARSEGVTHGLRKREAQSRCPQLVVVDHEPGRDARAFEPVVAAVERVVAGVEVLRPGVCAMAASGPARYFGGEEAAAEQVVEQVAQECGVEAQASIADGVFAAEQAARAGRIVPPGAARQFLADLDVRVLERPELTDRLRRLGIRTLGDFAALPSGDVLARFGFDAALAQRLAAGADDRPLAVRRPPPDLVVEQEYEEPLDRVDTAAFAARALAERLHERLAAHSLACTRLGVEAVTAHGQERHRTWRHDGLLTVPAITDRVRWQLEAWLTGPARARPTGPAPQPSSAPSAWPPAALSAWPPAALSAWPPATPSTRAAHPTAGIVRLRLVPDGVVAHLAQQPGLWGGAGAGRQRAQRALARVQSMLGPESVLAAVRRGGRSPRDQIQLAPWGEEPVDGTDLGGSPSWPGQLPTPAPATVLPEPVPARVQDADGRPVRVSARLALSAAPAWLTIGDAPPVEITGWAGPWPVEERWWAPAEEHRAARFQVRLADGRALLLILSTGQWRVDAEYD